MGFWAKLAAKAAFRNGKAKYCNYVNDVTVGTWSGGVVGLKNILCVKSRVKALEIMDTLSYLGYIEYTLDTKTKKLTYKVMDYVVKCSGEPCLGKGAVYATDGYGFLCLPRNITQRLTEEGYTFEEADAWLDLWYHTVYQDPRNVFSFSVPAVQYGQNGAALTLETLGQRWGWEKTKVWRFLQKHQDAFALRKLPGSFGCLIFNTQYPGCMGEQLAKRAASQDARASSSRSERLAPKSVDITIPSQTEIIRILDEIRMRGNCTHLTGSDNERLNRQIALHSQSVSASQTTVQNTEAPENRVAVSDPITRAYLSPSNCGTCNYDCHRTVYGILPKSDTNIRGPCNGP
jgi:hypothetical protein